MTSLENVCDFNKDIYLESLLTQAVYHNDFKSQAFWVITDQYLVVISQIGYTGSANLWSATQVAIGLHSHKTFVWSPHPMASCVGQTNRKPPNGGFLFV